jgi:membrane associated rhomboid family serine protease
MLYGGIISGLAPRPGISWEGHLFGAIAGLVAAKILAEARETRSILPEPPLDDPYWEV